MQRFPGNNFATMCRSHMRFSPMVLELKCLVVLEKFTENHCISLRIINIPPAHGCVARWTLYFWYRFAWDPAMGKWKHILRGMISTYKILIMKSFSLCKVYIEYKLSILCRISTACHSRYRIYIETTISNWYKNLLAA